MRQLPLVEARTRVVAVFHRVKVQSPVWDLPCPYCAQTFEKMPLLNKRLVVTHKVTRVHNLFWPERDALLGRPQCCHCLYKFSAWRGLSLCITAGSCPLFEPDLPPQEPPADQAIFGQRAQAEAWMALIEQPELIRTLRENCVLCGGYFFTGKVMLEHLNLNHFEMWAESKTKASVIAQALRDAHPCQACGKKADKAHACHVIRQMAIFHVLCIGTQRLTSPDQARLHSGSPDGLRQAV